MAHLYTPPPRPSDPIIGLGDDTDPVGQSPQYIINSGSSPPQSPSGIAQRLSEYLAAPQSSSPDRSLLPPSPDDVLRWPDLVAVWESAEGTDGEEVSEEEITQAAPLPASTLPRRPWSPPVTSRHLELPFARLAHLMGNRDSDRVSWRADIPDSDPDESVDDRTDAMSDVPHVLDGEGMQVDSSPATDSQLPMRRRMRTDGTTPKDVEVMELTTSSRLHGKKRSDRKAAKAAAEAEDDKENQEGTLESASVVDDPDDIAPSEERHFMGDWQLGLALGSGANGIVKVSRNVETGRLAAIKVVSKLDMEPALSPQPAPNRYTQRDGERLNRMVNYLEREVSIMRIVDHDNILKLWDVYEDVSHMYMLLEYIEGGELFDYLTSRGRLSADEASFFFKQVVAGVGHLHQLNIIHRDLKPENILITRKFQIKVADFGLAAFQAGTLPLQSSCGSPHYAAPEVVSGENYDGPAVDVWSVGIMLYACLIGRLPFDSEDELPELLRLIQKCEYYLPNNLPTDASELIRKMLRKRPADRITMADITEHRFCKRNYVPTKADEMALFADPLCNCDEAHDLLEEDQEVDASIFAAMVPMLPHLTENHIMQSLKSTRKTWEKVLYWHLMSEQASHKPVTVDDWSLVGPPPGDEDRRMAIDDWCRPSSDPGPSYLFARGEVTACHEFRFTRTRVPRRAQRRTRRRFMRRVSSTRHTAKLRRDFRARSTEPDANHLRPGAVSRLNTQWDGRQSPVRRNSVSAVDHGSPQWTIGDEDEGDDRSELVETSRNRLDVSALPATDRMKGPHWSEQSTRLQDLLITRRQAIIETMEIERYDTRSLYQPPEPSPWFHDVEATATTPARRRWPFSPYSRPKGYDYILPRTPLLVGFEGTPYTPKQHSKECTTLDDTPAISPSIPQADGQLAIGEVLSPSPRPTSSPSAHSPHMPRGVRQLPPTPGQTYASPVMTNAGSLAPSPVPADTFASPALDDSPVVRSALLPPQTVGPARALPAVPMPSRPLASPPTPEPGPAVTAEIVAPSFTRGPLSLPPLPTTPVSPALTLPLSAPSTPYNPTGRLMTPASVYTPAQTYASPASHATSRFSAVSSRPSPGPSGPRSPRHHIQSPALTTAIPLVQPRRSLAVRSPNATELGGYTCSPQPTIETHVTPPMVGSLYTPKSLTCSPAATTSATPLVHPQPRRAYDRPSVPLGARIQVDKQGSVSDTTSSDDASVNTNVMNQLLSPATAHQSHFRRPPQRGMQLDNRGPRPAPLTLVPNTSGRTPPLSAHSQLGSPLDTPSLSVIVTPALGFFDPSAPQPVLQELKGALPRRGWMDKALGNKSLYYEMLSPQDTETTRDECKRVLTYLGAVVQIEDSEGWGNLKVHSNEIRDMSGVLIHKLVRLKIGFMPKAMGLIDPLHPRSPATPRSAGYRPTSNPPSTVITIIMERGSTDAFNAIYSRLKEEYGQGPSLDLSWAQYADYCRRGQERERSPGTTSYPSPYRAKQLPYAAVPKTTPGPPSPQLPQLSSFDERRRPGELFSAEELAYIHRT